VRLLLSHPNILSGYVAPHAPPCSDLYGIAPKQSLALKLSPLLAASKGKIMTSLRSKLSIVVIMVLLVTVARAQHLVQFINPTPSTETHDGTLQVKIRIDAPALPSSLYVEANGKDITPYFNSGGCYSAPCEFTTNLDGNVLDPGWNFFSTSIHTENAAVDSDHVRVYNHLGALNATTGYAAPFTVRVIAKQQGAELGYSPETGNNPANYPYLKGTRCPPGDLFLLVLDRSTLSFRSSGCFGTGANASLATYLGALTKSDLVVGGNSGSAYNLGPLDLSKIGGTNFAASGAPTAWGYSVVGFGGASDGLAYESYTTSANGPWMGVTGELVDMASTSPMYGFRPTDSPAFVVQPGMNTTTGSGKITIGYPRTFPIGGSNLPSNFTLPASFTNTTYTSPACSTTCAGAVWALVFDSMTMQLVSSRTYATNGPSGTTEMTRFADDIKAISTSDVTANKVVFLTTLGSAFGAVSESNTSTAYASAAMVNAVAYLGISPNAFNKLLYGGQFSMVGIPGSTPIPGQTQQPLNKWYSSTQQTGDTGSLSGLLVRNHRFKYEPSDVGSITIEKKNPTADELLAFAIPSQLAVAPAVAWPFMDTIGRRNAYAYISNYMQMYDFYGRQPCRLSANQCEDIRFRYTTGEMKNIISGVNPADIPYPDDTAQGAKKFTQSEFTTVGQQLQEEKQYLSSTSSYQLALTQINTNATLNVGAALQTAATNVASTLNPIIGGESANESSLKVASDAVRTTGAVLSAFGPLFPPAGIAGGLLGASGGVMSMMNNAKPAPDPRIKQLGDLLAQHNGAASQYAVNFNSQIQASTGMFFNGVYADWFKLQTVGLMAVNPGSGWNFSNVGNAMTDFNHAFIRNARTSFYEQTVSQYFSEIRVHDYQFSYVSGSTRSKDEDVANNQAGFFPTYLDRSYSWLSWPTPGAPQCMDYVYMVTKDSRPIVPATKNPFVVKTWPSELGTLLMGPAQPDSTTGNLGIPREFFYDTSGYNFVRNWKVNTDPKNYCTKR
jgi:hypothetical protein